MILKNLNTADFLNRYWQQQPAVLKQLIPDFEDSLDEHDLAGIAQENDADSRIVSRSNTGEWTTTSGPFEDFNAVCVDQWSLLVQGVERYIESIDDLFEHFAFLPYWRMDDVMVSYSTEGAGVGAHIDQYDVFLIQGKGQRRWQIGQPGEYKEDDNNGLRQIQDFEPIIDVVTRAGDVIYIPPGWPHKGETIENSLTYSIGFRAPDTDQLVNVLHEALETTPSFNQCFSDPNRQSLSQPAIVTTKDTNKLKNMLVALVNNPDFDQHLLTMLSDCYVLDTDQAQTISLEDLQLSLLEGVAITRMEGIRPLYSEQQTDPAQFQFHINGDRINCDAKIRDWIEPLLNNRSHTLQLNNEDPVETLSKTLYPLINNGYYFID